MDIFILNLNRKYSFEGTLNFLLTFVADFFSFLHLQHMRRRESEKKESGVRRAKTGSTGAVSSAPWSGVDRGRGGWTRRLLSHDSQRRQLIANTA